MTIEYLDVEISNSTLKTTKTGVCMDSTTRMHLGIRLQIFNESLRSSTQHRSLSMVLARMILFRALLAIAGSARLWLRWLQQMAWWRDFVLLSVVLFLASQSSSSHGFSQRDVEVGVYGFIFFRDTQWVVVIVDESVSSFP